MGLYKRGDIWWYNFVHDDEQIQKSSRMADQAEQLTDNETSRYPSMVNE
jgi:hypothetical protein